MVLIGLDFGFFPALKVGIRYIRCDILNVLVRPNKW
jgi:hypothetical protein